MPNKFSILGLSVLLVAPLASASVAKFKTFDEKVEAADSIVRGRAVATQSRFDESGSWIVTETTFTIDETLKGEPGSTLTIITPGGRVGNLNQRTVGVPEFAPGDERILFTTKQGDSRTILYQEQGTYEVVQEAGSPVVVPASSDLVLFDPDRGTVEVAERPRSLESFRSEVVQAMRPQRPGRIQEADLAPRQEQKRQTPWVILSVIALTVIIGAVVLSRKLR